MLSAAPFDPTPALVADLSPADSGTPTTTSGTILNSEQADAFTFTISQQLGRGRLSAEVVAGSGDLIPRLTLVGPNGKLLIASDSGSIAQHLRPGDYSLVVSAQTGLGDYQLTTQFATARPPLVPLPVGTLPRSVAVGDFNLDGQPDIVASNLLDATVSVMLGSGDGTFQPQQLFATSGRPISVKAADVNGDGAPDIVVANKDADAVGVLLGNGDGTFQPQTLFAVGSRPSAVEVADLNGDGKPDVAVSNYDDASVSVLLGNGDGTFQAQQSFATGSGPYDVAVADIDGDGIPDLVATNYTDGTVSLLLGNGVGSFAGQQTVETGGAPRKGVVADINGDGLPDIVVANYSDDSVSVLLGNGNGTFQEQQVFSAGTGAYTLCVADLNGDGNQDVAAISFGANSVNVLLGNGDGTLAAPTGFAAGRGTGNIAVADLDGDGRPDVVTTDFTDNTVSVLLGRGDGTLVTRTSPPPVPDMRVYSIAVADLNGDGRPDIVTDNKGDYNVSVLLLNADGSFQTRQTFPTGSTPAAAVIADINGDGVPDIITGSYVEYSASVLIGRGDGTFDPARNFDTGSKTYYQLSVADVNGDGRPDIVTGNSDATVSVLLNETSDADRPSFQSPQLYPIGAAAIGVTVADVTGDGRADIVLVNGDVAVLTGNGDGTFQDAVTIEVSGSTFWVIVDDINRDGVADIISTNSGSDNISVLLGVGGGEFEPHQDFATGKFSGASTLEDVTGDGIPDVITAGIRDGVGSLLAGRGDGTFEPFVAFPLGTDNSGMAVGDFNGDGRPDLAQGNFQNDSVTIVHGHGDGTFGAPEVIKLRKNRYSVFVADVNGDGKLDAIRGNLRQNSLSVRLGGGTGSFAPGESLDTGEQPTSVRAADFNGDGRTDLVAANSGSDSVSVLLGNGDGSFNPQQEFPVGSSPRTVSVADIDGDGILDLAIANYSDGTVSVLLGRGDGSFDEQQSFEVGQRPYSLTIADVDGDGSLDIVAANSADNTISVLLGRGDGSFAEQGTFATGSQPFDVAIADMNDDSIPDVMTADAFGDTVSLLLGLGDGTFQAATSFAVGGQPSSITVADLNGDGHLDLATSNFEDDSVSVLLGRGDGTFSNEERFESHLLPVQTVAADVDGDGRPDLVSVGNHDDTIGALLNAGDGQFLPATAATEVSLRNTPLRADLDGDGLPDSVVLDRAGNILFRKRLALEGNALAPPVILNPGRPARDIAIVETGSGFRVAAADARFDPTLSTDAFVFSVSLYVVGLNGTVSRSTAFSSTALPVRLFATDLTGNGLDDLIVANPPDNLVTISLQTLGGQFADALAVEVGTAPSSITVADVNADGLSDVLVANQVSGDVSVLLNDAGHRFDRELRFRAGTQPHSLDANSDDPVVSSFAQSVSIVSGDFTSDGRGDVIVVNRGAHSFTVLEGNGRGGFENPRLELTTSTSDGFAVNNRPGALKAGDFNGDGSVDLVLLMEDTGQAWIYTGSGHGTFDHTFTIPVGDLATGISIMPSLTSNFLDLLIGNGFGDVLHLEGKGDGTFQIQGRRVSLSVVPDLLGPGQAGVLVGNQEDNRVTVQTQVAGGTEFTAVQTLNQSAFAGQLAPGDVLWAQLTANASLPDAIVVSTGSNAVIVYHTAGITSGAPVFAPNPRTYFVGTAPASVTVADINDDAIPDLLVANRGSNDVSVVFGAYDDDGLWWGVPGPRLQSGGTGPIAVAVRELTGDGLADLAVVNGQGGTLTLLPGVGQGFFDDRAPQTLLNFGNAVAEPPSFVGDSNVGFAVTSSGMLTKFDVSQPGDGAPIIFSAEQVLAARALASDQVVVALANGSVKVLKADGDRFIVAAVLAAQSGTPVLPSSLVVLPTGSGQYQVLVSSQGSDTVAVFSAGQVQLIVPISFSIAGSQSNSSSGGFGLATSSASNAPNVIRGLSLSSFSASNVFRTANSGEAGLVSVEGNSYSAVPLLDFGSLRDDDEGDGRARMPWLSMRLPIGDASPLTQFITGLDELIDQYLRDAEALEQADGDASLELDPWDEDLFFPPPSLLQPIRKADTGEEREDDESGSEETSVEADNSVSETEQQEAVTQSMTGIQPGDHRHTIRAAVIDEVLAIDADWEQYTEHDLSLSRATASDAAPQTRE